MRQFLTYGSVRGVPGNRHPYRDEYWSIGVLKRTALCTLAD